MAKVTSGDPKALPVEAVLMMATVCGARAQGREAECGMLKLGMDADLVLLDFTSPHLMPCHNVMSHLVYAASGHDVVMTMVRGRCSMLRASIRRSTSTASCASCPATSCRAFSKKRAADPNGKDG